MKRAPERRTLGGEGKSRASARRAVRLAVDRDLCKACGICIAFCPASVFEADQWSKPALTRLGDCTLCRFCERHCPEFAIEVFEERGEPAAASGRTAPGARACHKDGG